MSEGTHLFKVSISDSFCEWTYDLYLSDNLSINNVAEKLCEAFAINIPAGTPRKPDDHSHALKEALEQAWLRTVPGCQTCYGHGEIGGFINAESGYENHPCTDCERIRAAIFDVPPSTGHPS